MSPTRLVGVPDRARETTAQHDGSGQHVFGDRVLVMERVGDFGARSERVECDIVSARPCHVHQLQSRGGGGHCCGEPAAHVHIGCREVVDDRPFVEALVPPDLTLGRQQALEQLTMRQQIPVADDDHHPPQWIAHARTSAGRLLSKLQPGTRNCIPTESSRDPRPSRRYSSCAASTWSMSSSTPSPGRSGTVR